MSEMIAQSELTQFFLFLLWFELPEAIFSCTIEKNAAVPQLSSTA